MSVRATVLRTDGTTTSEVFAKEPALEWLQTAVGGYIEMLSVGGVRVVVNEDGALVGLPINELAAERLGKIATASDGFLRGDVVVLEPTRG